MKSRDGYVRVVYHVHYAQQAKRNFARFAAMKTDLKIPPQPMTWKYLEQQSAMRGEAEATILFSALALEALIYHVSVTTLGEAFTDNHLDRLDVISKWLVVIRLISQKELPKTSKAYCLLRDLISIRNELAHRKSTSVLESGGVLPIKKGSRSLEQHAERAIEALAIVPSEVAQLTSDDHFLLDMD